MKHLEGSPLPPISASPDDEAWQERIGDLLRELDKARARSTPRVILRGGTAAKLGHGLTRPSLDIDVDLTEPIDLWALLTEAATRAEIVAIAKPNRGHTQKGELVLTDPGIATAAMVEVDVRTLRGPHTLETIRTRTVRKNGIWMYTARELARQKIEMATEPGRRRRSKDRYDIAWWLRTHIEHIEPEQRIALDEALRTEATLMNAWDNDHRTDRIMHRIKNTDVNDALMAALDRDPLVLQQRWPEGHLQIGIGVKAGATLTWNRSAEDTTAPLPVGTFNTDRELETFMTRMRVWTPQEAPEMLKELTLERVRALARNRNG